MGNKIDKIYQIKMFIYSKLDRICLRTIEFMNFLENLVGCYFSQVKEETVFFFLQQGVLLLTKHGEYLSLCFFPFCFFPLPYLTLMLPINSLKFLLRLKIVAGSVWQIILNDLFIDKILKYLRKNLVVFVKN